MSAFTQTLSPASTRLRPLALAKIFSVSVIREPKLDRHDR
jgi:hypothetical protein